MPYQTITVTYRNAICQFCKNKVELPYQTRKANVEHLKVLGWHATLKSCVCPDCKPKE